MNIETMLKPATYVAQTVQRTGTAVRNNAAPYLAAAVLAVTAYSMQGCTSNVGGELNLVQLRGGAKGTIRSDEETSRTSVEGDVQPYRKITEHLRR